MTASVGRQSGRIVLAALASAVLCSAGLGDVVRIEFIDLPYENGHNVTNEWESEGIIFSADDNGMDEDFPCQSLNEQENLVLSKVLFNLYRINFVADGPVVEVVCEFFDQNTRDQIHGLYELDRDLNILQKVEYDDRNGKDFKLRLINPNGIFGIAACEQPFGAERLKAIEFVIESCQPCDTNCDGSVDLLDVAPFIELILGGGEQCAKGCSGDANGDGSVDLTDVEGFIECLLG